MALGGALFEAVHFDEGAILNASLDAYRVPRFSDVPPVEVILLDRRDIAPAGADGTPLIAVAPRLRAPSSRRRGGASARCRSCRTEDSPARPDPHGVSPAHPGLGDAEPVPGEPSRTAHRGPARWCYGTMVSRLRSASYWFSCPRP